MNKYFNYFFSIPSALFLMCLFAVSIGVATFIENDYGTIAAKATVFNSWWLELCLFLLVSIFLYNIYKYKLISFKKLPILFFHLSFIFIIVGSAITRYTGKEGMMRIREGNFNKQFVSETTFLDFKIHNNKSEYVGKKPLLLSTISNNNFSIPIVFDNKKIHIKYVDFINDPVDRLMSNNKNGDHILEFIVPSQSGGMQSEYIKYNTVKKINNLNVSFNSKSDSDFIITFQDSLYYFTSKYDVDFMRMSNQNKGVLKRGIKHLLNQKTLYTINGKNMVFKNFIFNASISKIAGGLKNNQEKTDLLKIKITINNIDTVIDLYGHKGLISPKTYFSFKDLFFSFGYGSQAVSLPFAIYLHDFQLERYPGSDSPSSFASEIQVMDGENTFDYKIFMNNVLNYKGYRFFQSSYDSDEKGTILSVNKDRAGTLVTYFGYLCLLLSVISLLLSRFSRFNNLSKQNNNKSK